MRSYTSCRHCTPSERKLLIRTVKSFLESSTGTGKVSQGEIVRTLGPKCWPQQRVSEVLKEIDQEDAKNIVPDVRNVHQEGNLATQTTGIPTLPIWASDPRFKPFVDADLASGYSPYWITDSSKQKYETLASKSEQAAMNKRDLEAAREKKLKKELGKTAAKLAELAKGDTGAAVKQLGKTLESVTATVTNRCAAVLNFQSCNDLTRDGHRFLRERLLRLQGVVKEQLDALAE